MEYLLKLFHTIGFKSFQIDILIFWFISFEGEKAIRFDSHQA